MSQSAADFWRRHVHVGAALYGLAAVGVFVYLRATPDGPHRGTLQVVDGLSVAVSIPGFWWLGLRLVRTRWRLAFLCTWSAFTLTVIAIAAWLDGGESSPVVVLLVLPVLFTGLAYPPAATAAMGAAAEAVFVLLAVADADGSKAGDALVGMTVGLAGLLALAGAYNRRGQEDRLYELATHDGLTGCLNYHSFQERLAAEAARASRYGRRFSVVMADVDHLKEINDALGHRVGDEALKGVANALAAGARAADVVGRLGGDEFAVLLPETDTGGAVRIVDRQIEAVRGTREPVPITVSFGTSTWSGPDDTAEALLRRADEALYRAKEQGRDQVVGEPAGRPARGRGGT